MAIAMSFQATNDILNRLLIIHSRSLANYLIDAPPRWADDHGKAATLLADVVADQQDMADRIGGLILASGGTVNCGRFPDIFTSLHDLDAGFMLATLLGYQQRTVAAMERAVERLAGMPMAQALAQGALGMAKAHLDSMSEVAGKAIAAPAHNRP